MRTLVRLAFDTMPVIATWGGSSEEFEKRLGALLLQAPGALSIDNANGMQVKGDLLEAILTEGSANIRPLGVSETVKVRNRSLITLTGNNPIITGDMARTSTPIDILPRSADPERDRYGFNPVELCSAAARTFCGPHSSRCERFGWPACQGKVYLPWDRSTSGPAKSAISFTG